MELNEITQLIGSVGFPIVMVLIACYYIKYLNDIHKEEVTNINNQYSEQIEKLTTALNNNTLIMTELKTMLSQGINKKDGD